GADPFAVHWKNIIPKGLSQDARKYVTKGELANLRAQRPGADARRAASSNRSPRKANKQRRSWPGFPLSGQAGVWSQLNEGPSLSAGQKQSPLPDRAVPAASAEILSQGTHSSCEAQPKAPPEARLRPNRARPADPQNPRPQLGQGFDKDRNKPAPSKQKHQILSSAPTSSTRKPASRMARPPTVPKWPWPAHRSRICRRANTR